MAEVSILVPVYNTEKYIGATIESILKQTFTDFDLIILDDCSTDGTFPICQQYADRDSRIKLYRNERNLGMMRNWNEGLNYCHNKYFVKLDADDWWQERLLQECYEILEKDQEIGLVFSKYQLVDEVGEIVPSFESGLPEFARNKTFSGVDLVRQGIYKMLGYNVLKQGIGLIRRKIFDELGFFSLHDAGDTEMWFRIAAHYKIYGLDKLYYFYRVWPANFTRQKVLQQGKLEKNLFEVRGMIFNYYFGKGLISQKEFMKFAADNDFEYNKFLIYRTREDGNIRASVRLLISNLRTHPVKTIQFYVERLLEKLRK